MSINSYAHRSRLNLFRNRGSVLPNLIIDLLGVVDVLQQRGVGDLLLLVIDLLLQVVSLQGQHRHCGLVVVSLRALPLNQDAAAKEGVEFLLVGNMSLEVYLARVALLLARPLHQISLRD